MLSIFRHGLKQLTVSGNKIRVFGRVKSAGSFSGMYEGFEVEAGSGVSFKIKSEVSTGCFWEEAVANAAPVPLVDVGAC